MMVRAFFSLCIVLIFSRILYSQSDYPPCVAYSFNNADTLRVGNSYSNTLYVGIDNELILNKSYFIVKNMTIISNNGSVIEDEGRCYVIPSHSGRAQVKLIRVVNKDTTTLLVRNYEVKMLPQPFIMLGGTSLNDISYVRKEFLLVNRIFNVRTSFDIIDDKDWYKVKDITLGYKIGQLYKTRSCMGSSLNQVLMDEIEKIQPGKEINFVFRIESDGGVIKRLDPIKLILY